MPDLTHDHANAIALAETAAKLAAECRTADALRAFEAVLASSTAPEILGLAARFFLRIGNLARARDLALRGAEGATEPLCQADFLFTLGCSCERLGHFDEAERRFREAASVFDQLHLIDGVANCTGRIGVIYKLRGDLEGAETLLREALSLSGNSGPAVARQLGEIAKLCRIRGNLDEATKLHRQALAIYQQSSDRSGIATSEGNLGVIYLERSELDSAEHAFEVALEMNEALGNLEEVATSYGNLGIIQKNRGNFERAGAFYAKALDIETQLGRREGIARAYANLGTLEKQRTNLEAARTFWLKALEIYSELGMSRQVQQLQALFDAS